MTVININKVVRNITRIEELIIEIKKIKPNLNDEEILEIIIRVFN